MRKAIFLLFLLALAGAATAQVSLKDVPPDHWASSAVSDLVRLGVTKGYPDGTYRGDKPITRYETAIFLSKLAKAMGGDELRTDIKSLRDEIVQLKKSSQQELAVDGNYEGDWRMGNLMSRSGGAKTGAASYRLIVTTTKELSDSADVKVNLDTMDYGYFDDGSTGQPGRGMLASELLDLESNLKLAPVNLKLTYGPGPKQHLTDPTGAFPSEVGVTYWRPDTGIEATTNLFGVDVLGGYYSVQGSTLETSGRINTSWLTGGVGYTFSQLAVLDSLKIDLMGDYVSHGLFSTTDRSVKAKVDLLAALAGKAKATTTVGLAKKPSGMMVAGSLSLEDPLATGTVITVKAAKVGSEYIDPNRFAAEQFDLAGYDNFDRPLENGTVNIGGELVQAVTDRAKLIGKGDLRLNGDYKYEGPKARITAQGGIQYNIAPNVNLDAAYRVYQDKGLSDTSDMASFGLLYNF